MRNVIIPLNAFDRGEVLKNGQASFVEHIAQAGAYGVEIRRELLPEEKNRQLDQIRQEIARFGLFTVYSAPIECWKADHHLNIEELINVFQEGKTLGATWLKVSLGHFHKELSNIAELGHFLKQQQGIQLLVENDQTLYGGNIQNMKSFFESAVEQDVLVKMTFDAGNWYYSSQEVEEALNLLAPYVDYLHLKQVEKAADKLVTVPLEKGRNHSWEKVFKHFPAELMKALEFPIEPKERAKDYLQFIQELAAEVLA
ncbi:sugar phosphate isomerase/epimerase [Bacillus sp. EB600]|uniref:sugar phosphate isomerase/epimerase family protein n=1 Tax=Bacillus sp. EB600 TaxID=2806345 RepID=UPI00210E065E|nr:TIM barrel protein [Bacillus sp. EB600]MCQ6278615.1 sugar phosphate isomerase/epimerase [Bacillus sp. EB600]